MAKQTFSLKIFLVYLIAIGSIAVLCFYCTTHVAWPLVCKMQADYNERKSQKKLKDEDSKAALLKKDYAKDRRLQRASFLDRRILKSHIKLLEYLEFHYGIAFSEKDIYEIFIQNTSASNKNMSAFFRCLSFLKKSNFIQAQAGKICLTDEGVKFLKQVRQKNYFPY